LIAQNFGVSVERLKQVNQLSAEGIIVIGQKLIIPDQASQHPLMGKHFENQRGTVAVTIYRQADGGERTEYGFISSVGNEYFNFVLVGDGLEALKKYHNLPVNIWGVVENVDQYNKVTMRVEKYEIPFPDLQIQLFKGKYENATVNGREVTLFVTTDGPKYVIRFPVGEIGPAVDNPDETLQIVEGLSIPDESFGGYPTLIPLGGGMATDSTTGDPIEYSITADQPYVIDEAQVAANATPPEATIEKVELVYYVPDPRYVPPEDRTGTQYIQPAWRFHGHFSNGDEFEILVQALKPEYLTPELAPYTPPG